MRIVVISGKERFALPIRLIENDRIVYQSVDVYDENLTHLIDKFDSLENVPHADAAAWRDASLKRALEAIWAVEDESPDVVIGTGLGAQVLANLISLGDWSGPSVFIFPEGFYKTTHIPHSRIPSERTTNFYSAWILQANASVGPCMKKYMNYQAAACVTYVSASNESHVYNSGLLESTTRLVFGLYEEDYR